MCVAAAIGASAAAGLAGSAISASGAQSAADTQAAAQQQASAQQMQMFNTIVGQEQPFMQAGQNAASTLQELLGLTSGTSGTANLPNGYLNQTMAPFDPSSITSSPGYQFAQTQGLNAVANAESPNVGALSGPALKALTNFSTGTAAQYYNDYFNQYNTQFNQQQAQKQNIFSRLSTLAGIGQNAASNTGTAGAALGTGAAQATAYAGGSQAAGQVGAANALSSGLSGAGNTLGSYLSLNNMLSGGGAPPAVYGQTAAGNPNYFTMPGS